MSIPVGGGISGQSGSSSGVSQTNYNPQDVQQIRQSQSQLSPLVQSLIGQSGQASQAAGGTAAKINTDFSGNNVALNSKFQSPNFNQPLDATARNLMSVQQGANQAQSAGQQRQIAGMGGQNPGVSQVLQQQNQNANKLQNNPLAFGAAQEQQNRLLNQANVSNQAQQMGNQAQLSQSQANSGLQQMGNQSQAAQQASTLQALQSALGMSAMGVGAAQNQLGTNIGVGQAMGQNVQSGDQSSVSRNLGFGKGH